MPPSLCSVHKDFRIPLLTQKLKTTWDKSQPAYSIIQKKKIQAKKKEQFFGVFLVGFFLPRILQRRKFLDAWRWTATPGGSQGNLCISITPEQGAIEKVWTRSSAVKEIFVYKRFLNQQNCCEARQRIIWPKDSVQPKHGRQWQSKQPESNKGGRGVKEKETWNSHL